MTTNQTTDMTAGEMLLVINDIHSIAIAARMGGDDGSLMLEIEQLAEDAIARSCEQEAGDTGFVEDHDGQ